MRPLPLLPILLCAVPVSSQSETGKTPATGWNTDEPPGPSRRVELSLEEGTWMNLDVSPDGKTIVFDLLGDIFTIPIKGGEARPLVTGHAYTVQPRFSPDGTKIAFTSDAGGGDNLWIMDADGKNRRQVTKESFRLINNPAWTPDGKYLVGRKHFTGARSLGAGELWMYPVTGGSGIRLTDKRNDQQDTGEPEISPDGRHVYYSEDVSPGGHFDYNRDPNGVIYVIQRLNLETGETTTVCRAPGGSARPEISPSGKELAFIRRVRGKTVLMVQNLDTGAETAVYDGLSKDGQETWSIFGVYPNFAWTPDGNRIVIWAKGKIEIIDLETREARNVPFLATAEHRIRDALRFPQAIGGDTQKVRVIRWPQLDRERGRVYFQALGQIWKRNLPDGQPERLTKAEHFEYYPCLSPDGRQLVYTTWDDQQGGRLMAYDLQFNESRTLVDKPGHYAEPSFDATGERVLFVRLGSGSTRGSAFVTRPGVYLLDMMAGVNRFVTRQGRRPRFHPNQDRILVLDREGKDAALVSLNMLGHDRRVLATSQYATDIALSPDGSMVAWEELFHVYVSPMPAVGRKLVLAPKRSDLPVARLTRDAGEFLSFSPDGRFVHHNLAGTLQVNDMVAAIDHVKQGRGKDGALPPHETIDLSFEVPADNPRSEVVLTNARLLTMEGDGDQATIERGFIHVRGNRIAALGPMSAYRRPAGVTEIDASGKTIMPGIVDVHAHMRSGSDGMLPQNNWSYMANLAFGVTTTHDPSHDTKMVFAAAELVRTGRMLGPRMFSTGTILYGADGDFKAVIDSEADAASHIRRTTAFGAFSVKSYNQPRRDQRQQVIVAAAKQSVMVVPEGGSMFFHNLSMILDGHTTLEHALPVAPVYEDVLQLFAASRTAYNPTLVVGYGGIWGENYWYQHTDVFANQRLLAFVPRSLVDQRARRRTKFPENEWHHIDLARSAAKLMSRGVIASVSAHGQMQGLCSHWDLWMFQEGGMSNFDALKTATIHGAKALGLDVHVGSLKPGKLADLVVLNSNPLEDIRKSEDIHQVMKNGRLYDSMTLAEVLPRKTKAPKLPFLGVVHVLGAGCSCHVVR